MIAPLLLLGLVACQFMWHGGQYLLGGLLALPLLAVLPAVWRKRRGALVVSGLVVIVYFVIGATEWIAAPSAGPWPALQVTLALAYLAWLHFHSRSRRMS